MKKMIKFILKYNYKKVLEVIRGTIIFNAIKIIILEIGFLYIIFLMVKENGYVSVVLNEFNSLFNMEFRSSDFESQFYGDSKIELQANKEICVYCFAPQVDGNLAEVNIEVNGEKYYGNFSCIYIKPNGNSKTFVRVNNANLNFVLAFDGVVEKSIYNLEYESGIGMHIKKQDDNPHLDGLCLLSNDVVELEFENGSAYIYDQANDIETQINSCKFIPSNNGRLSISLNSRYFDSDTIYDITILNNTKYLAKFGNITSIEAKGLGTLYYSNTASTKEYLILNQIIKVKEEKEQQDNNSEEVNDGNFTVNYESEIGSNKISFDGYTEMVTIAGHSITANLIDWFNDNIYMLPAMLLTVFTGAINLSNKYKNIEKK